ncbi:MAG: hypothetical protein AAGK09_14000 [Planctomycetota bacterium]
MRIKRRSEAVGWCGKVGDAMRAMWDELGGWQRVAMGGVALVLLAGCYEERVVSRSLDDLRMLADPKPMAVDPGQGAGRGGEAAGTAYAIRVGEYVGVGRHAAAQAALQELEASTGLTGGWMRDTGRSITAYLGRYSDPSGKAATRDLAAVRESGIDQTARANFTALAPGQAIVTDPLDAKAHRGAYSLQVAIYNADFGATYRRAAEQAARALREQGEEAFFYHGPHRSMVLLGLFSRDIDFATRSGSVGEQVEVYGPRIVELRRAYPYNLLNGSATYLIDEEGNRTDDEPMESFVVRIL